MSKSKRRASSGQARGVVDAARELLAEGRTPNLARLLPGGAWEERHSPGSFTYAAHQAFFADYAGLASRPITRGELRSIRVPVTIVTAPRTPPDVRAAAEALAALIPGARHATGGDLGAAASALLVD